jgi:amino acid transporter
VYHPVTVPGLAREIRRWARTHQTYRTPVPAILLTAGLAMALTLWSTFEKQVNLSVIAGLISYGVTCAALIVLRRRPATALDVRDTAIAAGIGLAIRTAYATRRRSRAGGAA